MERPSSPLKRTTIVPSPLNRTIGKIGKHLLLGSTMLAVLAQVYYGRTFEPMLRVNALGKSSAVNDIWLEHRLYIWTLAAEQNLKQQIAAWALEDPNVIKGRTKYVYKISVAVPLEGTVEFSRDSLAGPDLLWRHYQQTHRLAAGLGI